METEFCIPIETGIVVKGAGLELRILSSDPQLQATCQDVLRSLEGPQPGSQEAQFRICLWDFAPHQARQ